MTLRREERLRLERKVVDVQGRLPAMRAELAQLDAEWQAASGVDEPISDALYEASLEAARKLALRIEDEERDLECALDELASDDRRADDRAYLRGVR